MPVAAKFSIPARSEGCVRFYFTLLSEITWPIWPSLHQPYPVPEQYFTLIGFAAVLLVTAQPNLAKHLREQQNLKHFRAEFVENVKF